MQVFKDAPYNLEFRDLIVARVRAYNLYGWQIDYSPANTSGVTVRREPSQMGIVSVDSVGTTIS